MDFKVGDKVTILFLPEDVIKWAGTLHVGDEVEVTKILTLSEILDVFNICINDTPIEVNKYYWIPSKFLTNSINMNIVIHDLNEEIKICNCDINILMSKGCQCGGS